MTMIQSPTATLTLSQEDLVFLEDSLQRDAVSLLQSATDVSEMLASPVYRANRTLFGKVWDALYTTGLERY